MTNDEDNKAEKSERDEDRYSNDLRDLARYRLFDELKNYEGRFYLRISKETFLKQLEIYAVLKKKSREKPIEPHAPITKPPGHHLLRLVEIVVSPKHYKTVFEPLVADWRMEYFDALSDGRGSAKIFFIHARYIFAFGSACSFRALWSVVDRVHKLISKSA